MRSFFLVVLASLLSFCASNPSLHPVTAKSSGQLNALQESYDVQHYSLEIEIKPEQKWLIGDVSMTALAVNSLTSVEMDLDPRFKILGATIDDEAVEHQLSQGKLILNKSIPTGSEFTTRVQYEGRPYEAENPPWDGGFVWNETEDGSPWIATAVQGRGCDLYWPCKDHISDKPDHGADMKITVPGDLTAVMNGVLISTTQNAGKKTFHWKTTNPISAYHLAINIGPFKRYEQQYQSVLDSSLQIPVTFFHVTDDIEKIDTLIKDDFMAQINFYERTLGPYPWGDEKIGLVEIPYLGMEHQTMNGYGNEFRLDPDGFDWLIQHEFAHEWFGNLMTQDESKDFWLHEGFANYMQPVYAQEVIGDAAFWSKMWDNYNGIQNCKAVVPDEDVDMDYFDSNDPYFKGSWTLHTLRYVMGEEKFWRAVRTLIYDTADPWSLSYPIKPTRRSTEDFIEIASNEYGQDLTEFFRAYLYEAELPLLETSRSKSSLTLSFSNNSTLILEIPVLISDGGETTLVKVKSDGMPYPLPELARIQIDPHTKILRNFGTSSICSNL